ncbi:LAO/AO transport system kinase [Desulfobotulus alkaliphilus]|uniref:LAO/AO transport system kinase n=1 Tax=Desulfobotulus alkaliphilus TaxID=622671 RepID=A0A562RRI6_9BACT|nr:methylmalonyl Co-A mutase-associated GTPase MeaB [Desulfobotulus alkaliphilus]TWI71124.1 LAO/AO transport system kinase [Desulfobotulus alkaliphilus]
MVDKVKKIQSGDVRSASRLIRHIEDNVAEARSTMKDIFPLTGHSHVVGLTGPPGAGKSTLVDGLIDAFRKMGRTVGVIAVDPTSPFTGGAILGDRIRMQRHAEDPGVFVRSVATRGALGGLSRAVGDAIHIMDVMGKDVILVETVGTGQQEVDIMHYAHTVLVVLIPGMGDDIQAIKAGILEIASIFVINKAEREGSSKLRRELVTMLNMAPESAFPGGWRPPILKCDNAFEPSGFSQSVSDLALSINEHYEHLVSKSLIGNWSARKAATEFNEAIRCAILDPVLNDLMANGELDAMIGRLVNKETDPYTLAEEIATRYLKKMT